MRWICGGVLMVMACSPAVDTEGGESTGMDGSGGSPAGSTGPVDPTTANPTQPNPTTGPMPTTVADSSSDSGVSETSGVGVEGEYYAILAAVVAEDTPFQFVGTVKADDVSISMSLTPLSLDVLSVDTPRELVPPPIELTGTVDPEGVFAIEAREVAIPGRANPITGSDIVVSLRIEGVVEDDLICARASGMVTVPANIDLTGSTFSAMPTALGPEPDPQSIPLPSDIGCP